MRPKIGILDRSFRYTPASNTDLRATFRRARREMRRADEAEKAAAAEAEAKVRTIRRRNA